MMMNQTLASVESRAGALRTAAKGCIGFNFGIDRQPHWLADYLNWGERGYAAAEEVDVETLQALVLILLAPRAAIAHAGLGEFRPAEQDARDADEILSQLFWNLHRVKQRPEYTATWYRVRRRELTDEAAKLVADHWATIEKAAAIIEDYRRGVPRHPHAT
jgi:hypothetical protein